jgi:hypothetical protein
VARIDHVRRADQRVNYSMPADNRCRSGSAGSGCGFAASARALLHSRIRARQDEPVSPSTRRHLAVVSRSAFAGCRFPIEVDHVTVYR